MQKNYSKEKKVTKHEIYKYHGTILQKNFKGKSNFTHGITTVDGKYMEIVGCGMESQYYNYKSTKSIVLLVVVRSNYE